MRILFDYGTPSRIAAALDGHAVTEAIDRGWDQISNGDLLKLAEEAGFAYKDISAVVDAVDQIGISRKVVQLKPIGNIKG